MRKGVSFWPTEKVNRKLSIFDSLSGPGNTISRALKWTAVMYTLDSLCSLKPALIRTVCSSLATRAHCATCLWVHALLLGVLRVDEW